MSIKSITVNNISKEYLIGTGASSNLRQSLINSFNRFILRKPNNIESFWAVKDISFELEEGKALGIIGKNGAGKSTLLKLLSKITYPTKGEILLKGRVTSLLEVGTGFHPELTGYENIFLNGTILGMSRNEIKNKFDAIVDFSGVEKFLYTPVKRYSSGMYVRLAFAVAAYLEPEILIIDEVLAVGDAEFQKKCLGKMNDVAKSGRTVVFVSHNMEAIKNLCDVGLFLEKGSVKNFGDINTIVSNYISDQSGNLKTKRINIKNEISNDSIKLLEASITSESNSNIYYSNNDLILKFKFKNYVKEKFNYDIAFHLYDQVGNFIVMSSSAKSNENFFADGEIYGQCIIPKNLLHEGTYTIHKLHFAKNKGHILFEATDVITFEVSSPKTNKLGYMGSKQGIINPIFEWELSQ